MEGNEVETIVAQATPSGYGGVGVIRISGPKVPFIADQILGFLPEPRRAEYASFLGRKGETLDQGIALYFKTPHSFTGEEVLELQGHGGPYIIDSLLQRIVTLGARLARPGEFSERAFLNNKIDLLQAEAVLDLIHANSEEAAKGAMRSLQGEFSKLIDILVKSLIHLRMYVESALDFPDEEIDFLNQGNIEEKLTDLIEKIQAVETKARQGVLLSKGLKVVIVGKPNVGKSSLLNCLSGRESAIVTDIPGTTRDVLKEQISIDGLLLQLVDTAGLRDSQDIVEQEGIKRAKQELLDADHIIVVVESAEKTKIDPKMLFPEWINELPSETGITVLCNKIDVLGLPSEIKKYNEYSVVFISVKTGEGISLFLEHLKETLGFKQTTENTFIARRRHLESLVLAKEHLKAALQFLRSETLELMAEELRGSQQALDQITGKFTTDDLLGKIFSEFCIGK